MKRSYIYKHTYSFKKRIFLYENLPIDQTKQDGDNEKFETLKDDKTDRRRSTTKFIRGINKYKFNIKNNNKKINNNKDVADDDDYNDDDNNNKK